MRHVDQMRRLAAVYEAMAAPGEIGAPSRSFSAAARWISRHTASTCSRACGSLSDDDADCISAAQPRVRQMEASAAAFTRLSRSWLSRSISSSVFPGGRYRRHTRLNGTGAISSTQPLQHPVRQLPRQRHVAAHRGPQSLDAIAPDHEPELERPKAAAELNAPVAIVHHLGVVRRSAGIRVMPERSGATHRYRGRSTPYSRSSSASTYGD